LAQTGVAVRHLALQSLRKSDAARAEGRAGFPFYFAPRPREPGSGVLRPAPSERKVCSNGGEKIGGGESSGSAAPLNFA